MTKRINFDHAQSEVVQALGYTSSEDITAATKDETNPDHLKLRLAAALLNANVSLAISVWASLLSGQPIVPNLSINLETLFKNYDDSMLKALDAEMGLYNRNMTTLTEEDLKAVVEVDKLLKARDA